MMTSINEKRFLQEVVEPDVQTPAYDPEVLIEICKIIEDHPSSNTVCEES
jgi:hypothetical protein